jgi:hypothetical protein
LSFGSASYILAYLFNRKYYAKSNVKENEEGKARVTEYSSAMLTPLAFSKILYHFGAGSLLFLRIIHAKYIETNNSTSSFSGENTASHTEAWLGLLGKSFIGHLVLGVWFVYWIVRNGNDDALVDAGNAKSVKKTQ